MSASSRESILAAVAAAQPEALPLPDLSQSGLGSGIVPSPAQAMAVLDQIGARVCRVASLREVREFVQAQREAGLRVASAVPGISGDVDLGELQSGHQLDGVEWGVMRASFGVCENGALWLDEAAMGGCRALPVIVQRWLVLVGTEDWVADMHEAYARLGTLDAGFGLFLAGPSKTADIEQCLVVGAHGVVEATVMLVDALTVG